MMSQVTTLTYSIAKRINTVKSPYIPHKYAINSIEEFLPTIQCLEIKYFMESVDSNRCSVKAYIQIHMKKKT